MASARRRAASALVVHVAARAARCGRVRWWPTGPGVRAHPEHDGGHERADEQKQRVGRQQPRPRPVACGRAVAGRRRCRTQQRVEAQPQGSQHVERIEHEKPGRAQNRRIVRSKRRLTASRKDGKLAVAKNARRRRQRARSAAPAAGDAAAQASASTPKPPYQSTMPYQVSGSASSGSQPISHHRLSAALAGPSPLARMAVWAAKEGAAQPGGQRQQSHAQGAPFGIQQHHEPQPEQHDAVGERQGQQRPVEPEEAGHGAGDHGAQPVGRLDQRRAVILPQQQAAGSERSGRRACGPPSRRWRCRPAPTQRRSGR